MLETQLTIKDLPDAVAGLATELTKLRGVKALVLGGSFANGTSDESSDWDFGLYYHGEFDLKPLAKYGPIFPPGSWGRIMNGGAWLEIDGLRVDVLLRDLETVEHWTHRAEEGEFEVDSLLGYVAGIPTYTLTAELASCRVLFGSLPSAEYPAKLAELAPGIWRFCRDFSLDYARKHRVRGNIAAAIGNVARAVMEEGHARMCDRREWACNEKRLIDSAGLGNIQKLFSQVPSVVGEIEEWIGYVADELKIPSDGLIADPTAPNSS